MNDINDANQTHLDREFAAFVAIDWADKKHAFTLQAAGQKKNTPITSACGASNTQGSQRDRNTTRFCWDIRERGRKSGGKDEAASPERQGRSPGLPAHQAGSCSSCHR